MSAPKHEWIDRAHLTLRRDFVIPLPKPIPASIPGWMYAYELGWLYEAAKATAQDGVEGDLLEVGSYKGLSASALGQAGALTCVDTFAGGEDLPDGDFRDRFDDAMRIMGLTPRVLQGRSDVMLTRLVAEGVHFRLILVDASHEFANVKDDLWRAWELLSPGGVLVADDYIGFPDVTRACDESGFGFVPVHPQRSKMAWARKRK